MFELRGKYGKAKVFADIAEETSIAQVLSLLNQPFAEGQCIRMMPDIHAGKGCTIGTTMTLTDKVCPNLVGVDIGCGMYAVKLEEMELDPAKLDAVIRERIPFGFNIHTEQQGDPAALHLEELFCKGSCDIDRACRSIGTLGGGNHFIECDRDKDGNIWLVIHTGSRHLGTQVAKHYQDLAIEECKARPEESVRIKIEELKKAGRQKDIEKTVREMKKACVNIPEDLCWCEGESFRHYLHDMVITQAFADTNRKMIAEIILAHMGLHAAESFTTIHNYIDMDDMILRKGAVSAKKGERLLIPMNMRDGSLLCIGKGNEDWNRSAPHGAGRLMSRSVAKEQVSLDEFRESMKNIWSTSVNASTLDESPMAYKPMESIIANTGDAVDIVDIIKPFYNFKASE